MVRGGVWIRWNDKGRSLDQIAIPNPSHMILETCSNKQLISILQNLVYILQHPMYVYHNMVYRPYTASVHVPRTMCLQET